jgi:hydroxyacylglutathione hydrolase
MPESRLRIECVVDPVFQENGYVVFERPGGRCWIIDPSFDPQPQQIAEVIDQQSLTPAAILITHCHGDHIVGIDALVDRWPEIDLYVPAAEVDGLGDARKNLSAAFGIALTVAAKATQTVHPGQALHLDGLAWQVLDVSGHSPGGVAYYCPAGKAVIVGDALFAGAIGRTDLPGSSERQLLNNIRRNLMSLPDDVLVYAGHGPSTTIGHERATNPFLQPGRIR